MNRSRVASLLLVLLVAESSCNGGGGADPDASGPGTVDGDCCPAGMALVQPLNICIDQYEASQGEGGKAVSVAGATPLANVNWYSARDACVAAGKRLCDESEWVGVCSGPAPGTVYPYGDTYDSHACNGGDHGVGSALPTGSMATCEGGYPGVFDMSGNLWEWTSTCNGSMCRVCGGSFFNFKVYAPRCSYPSVDYPDLAYDYTGFRCCVSL
ncbi:MAG: SUMF1/EgtB/PvdO family nonheme iron enzyme [Pseudomonadota bacterium]